MSVDGEYFVKMPELLMRRGKMLLFLLKILNVIKSIPCL